MNQVSINGKTYTAPDGCSITVINNKAYVNGKLLEDFNDWKEKNIQIKIEGNCNEIKADVGNIIVNGDVNGNVSSDTGNINVKNNIGGNTITDCGNIKAHHIFGNVDTDCGNINGTSKIKAFGNFGSKIQSTTIISHNKKNWIKNLLNDIFD